MKAIPAFKHYRGYVSLFSNSLLLMLLFNERPTWQYISPSIFSCAQADAMVGGKSTNMTTLFASMMLRKYGERSNCLKAGCIKTRSVNAWNTQPTIRREIILVPKPKNSASLSDDIFTERLEYSWRCFDAVADRNEDLRNKWHWIWRKCFRVIGGGLSFDDVIQMTGAVLRQWWFIVGRVIVFNVACFHGKFSDISRISPCDHFKTTYSWIGLRGTRTRIVPTFL